MMPELSLRLLVCRYGFVTFSDAAAADRALRKGSMVIDGRERGMGQWGKGRPRFAFPFCGLP